MLFFRSEEQVRLWCEEGGFPLRPRVTISQLWQLAQIWYSTRLEENSRRPSAEEMAKIFAGLGLFGRFWDPRAADVD